MHFPPSTEAAAAAAPPMHLMPRWCRSAVITSSGHLLYQLDERASRFNSIWPRMSRTGKGRERVWRKQI